MILDNYTRSAKIRKVVDGDTLEVLLDEGYRRYAIERIRLNRVNAPEIHGKEQVEGLKTKEYVESLLKEGTEIMITSKKTDAFGRWLGEVYYLNEAGEQINLSDDLLEKGMARPYERR